MGFQDEKEQRERKRRSWSDIFVKLDPDRPVVVQLLEPEVSASTHSVWKHWIPQARYSENSPSRGVMIMCPGYDVCPICQRNKELNDRDHPDYIGASRKIVVNVLDWTLTKVCPLCESENGDVGKCAFCDSDLREVDFEPPKVKLLERGKPLFIQMSDHAEEAIGPDGEPLDWTQILFKIKVSEDKRHTTPIMLPPNEVDYRDYEDKFITYDEAYARLTPVEIGALLSGGSMSEVFKGRREARDTEASEDSFGSTENSW